MTFYGGEDMLITEVIQNFKNYLAGIERSKKTIEGYFYDLNFFSKWIDQKYNVPCYIEDVTIGDLEEFLVMLKEQRNYKPASRRRIVATLSMFYRFACKKGYCEKNVVDQLEPIKVTQIEREFLSEEDVLDFIDNVNHALCKVVIYTMFYAGLRISECVNLKVEHVDLQSRRIKVIAGKGNKNRTIPINEKLLTKLQEYEKWRYSSEYFFATSKTGQFSKVRISAIIRETKEKLGIEKKITAHTFRHSFASSLVSKDVNIVSISKLLGHSDIKVTSIYTHTNMDRLEADINRM